MNDTKSLIEEQKKLNQETKELLENMKEEREKWEKWLRHFRDVTELMVSKR